jgi:hypothetical protein
VPEQISARGWLDLLRDGTRSYAAQPYQQLAAGPPGNGYAPHRALGHERETRDILMAQRDDQLARTHTRWSQRLWGRITKVTLGYGYQPWRALLFLAGVMVLLCVLAVVLGSHGALAQTGKTPAGVACGRLRERKPPSGPERRGPDVPGPRRRGVECARPLGACPVRLVEVDRDLAVGVEREVRHLMTHNAGTSGAKTRIVRVKVVLEFFSLRLKFPHAVACPV